VQYAGSVTRREAVFLIQEANLTLTEEKPKGRGVICESLAISLG